MELKLWVWRVEQRESQRQQRKFKGSSGRVSERVRESELREQIRAVGVVADFVIICERKSS